MSPKLFSRSVVCFEEDGWSPSGELVVDTGCVVAALFAAESGHRAWRWFFEELAAARSVVLFSRLVEIELFDVTFRLALKERWGNQWASKQLDGRARRRASRRFSEVFAAWEELLENLDYAFVEPHEVLQLVHGIMRDWGLRSNDAVHAATAIEMGVSEIATIDSGFGVIPESSLTLVTNRNRVAVFRKRRRRNN